MLILNNIILYSIPQLNYFTLFISFLSIPFRPFLYSLEKMTMKSENFNILDSCWIFFLFNSFVVLQQQNDNFAVTASTRNYGRVTGAKGPAFGRLRHSSAGSVLFSAREFHWRRDVSAFLARSRGGRLSYCWRHPPRHDLSTRWLETASYWALSMPSQLKPVQQLNCCRYGVHPGRSEITLINEKKKTVSKKNSKECTD